MLICFLFLEQGWVPALTGTGTEDLQHHRQPRCSLMDDSPPLSGWNLRITCSELTFHARTVPSTLHEYTWLQV